ncbi:MAG: hypothetical protein KF768_00690 [Phycisphaeraceae bacterium]|nr:hypothetical protein [Phycisphaeraceae bacterium]
MKSITVMFADMPRAVKWLVSFSLVMGGYFVLLEPVLDYTQAARSRAQALESRIARLASLGNEDTEEGRVAAQVLQSFGRAELPRTSGEAVYLLTRRINQVLDEAGVEDRTQIEKRSTFRPRGSDLRYERVIIEVSFDARPETHTRVLAALESSPEVTAVSRVRLDRSTRAGAAANQRLIRGTIAAEAWAQVDPASSLTAGGAAR